MIDKDLKDDLSQKILSSSEVARAVEIVMAMPEFRLLKRVPNRSIINSVTADESVFHAVVLDLETTGLDSKADRIIELGLLRFSFTSKDGIIEVLERLNYLQDPGEPITAEITKITGITDSDVKGQSINWDEVHSVLKKTDLCLAHNANFDRRFLETGFVPDYIRTCIEAMAFGCTQNDVDWRERGFESTKLEYINFKCNYFYEGHRALVDCISTLNLLVVNESSFSELLENVRSKTILLCAIGAPFERKDALKEKGYRWSSGEDALPKCWWTIISDIDLDAEYIWLDDEIYGVQGRAKQLPQKTITARNRYSYRSEEIN